jgi:signal transduction histidine kinase
MSLPKLLSQLSPGKLAWLFFGVIFGGTCLTAGYTYFRAVQHREAEVRQQVLDLAEAAAALVDVDLHEQLVRPEQLGSEDYRRVLRPLVKFHQIHSDIQYLWTTRVPAQGPQLLLLETSTDEAIRREQEQRGRGQDLLDFLKPDPVTEAGAKFLPTLRRGQAVVLPDIYKDSHGRYIEARAPLQDRTGRFVGYLGVDYALDRYIDVLNEVRLTGLISLLLALLVSVVVARLLAEMRRQTFSHLAQVQRAEAEMRAQRDLAAKANHAKSELLAIASHDLKNPLSAIAGMSGLLLEMKKTQPDQDAVRDDIFTLETIHASAGHMSEIVRGILVTEGIEQGGLPFNPVPTEIGALCEEVVKFNTPAAAKKLVALRTEFSGDLSENVDAKLLREAIDNYVSNAIKYAPKGRPTTVTLTAKSVDGGFEISVRDEGPGLTSADRANLFGKFKKLSARPTGGETSTGLGLSIVKTIAELHRGQVGCDSEPGKGARFWLRLPAVPPPAAMR